MNIYTIKSVKVLGEPDEQYGITYWGYVEEEEQPVMFNSRRTDSLDGLQLVCEETDQKRSKKGTPYLRLKKVKISEGKNSGQAAIPEDMDASLLKAMDGKLTLILKAVTRIEKQDKVAESDGSEITLDDFPDV